MNLDPAFIPMIVLFAFLHHLAAFTLVSAIAGCYCLFR